MSLYRPEFEAALRAFARASEAMKRKGFEAPILVGGGAAELYSGSAITTGDFDVVTGRQAEFEEELRVQGFTRPAGPGHTPLGWIHPDLKLGFEVVSGALLDGLADRERIRLFGLGEDGNAAVISVEDMTPTARGNMHPARRRKCSGRPAPCSACRRTPTWPIWNAASARRRQANMASKRSATEPKAVPLEDFAADLARRRETLGAIDMPRNSGKRRTASKRALLKAIEDAGGQW
jgi:hypothetical protein